MAHTQEISVQSFKGREQTKSSHPTANAISTEPSANALTYLTPTPIVITKLEDALAGHPDTRFVSQLCDNLRYGARIGFEGERTPRFSKNLPTAVAHPSIVTSNLENEISLGRVAGPSDATPFSNFQVSPIGLAPKMNSDKFRMIFHLSFPKSGTTSINSSISKEDFSLHYVTIDNVIEGIKRFGQGCFLAKTEFESAFRLIPVHKDDYELLGMFCNGKSYYDKVLPFGLRSAPFLLTSFLTLSSGFYEIKCHITFVCHILDDFLIIEPPSSSPPYDNICWQSLTAMLLTFRNISISIAASKTQGPVKVIEFMGIILDSVRMEARLPANKIERLRAAFDLFQNKRALKELQSIIGTLNFACKFIPPGRPFLQRMIELTRNISKPHHDIKLNAGFFKDLEMWKQFIVN